MAFFFATLFAYNSMLLIEIGGYLRGLESRMPGLGWAAHLKPRYKYIEILELISSAGLFIGTECIALLLYSTARETPVAGAFDPLATLRNCTWVAVVLTVVIVFYPWIYHRFLLKRT